MPVREDTGDVACELAREGVHGLHLYADYHGQDYSKDPRHVSASLKEVHQQLHLLEPELVVRGSTRALDSS